LLMLPVIWPSKISGYIIWYWMIWHHTLINNQYGKLLSVVPWGFTCNYKCGLWVLLALSQVNWSLSQDKMYWCNFWLVLSHLQNSSCLSCSPGFRCWKHCTWYGYMSSLCNVLRTLVWKMWICLEIHHILTPGLYCTTWMSCS
jgi:hypothetical protein